LKVLVSVYYHGVVPLPPYLLQQKN